MLLGSFAYACVLLVQEKVYSSAEAQQKLFMEHISKVEEENGLLDW